MGENNINELININNTIKEIEEEINNNTVTNKTIELYNKLIISQKELYNLKIDKKIKNKYSHNILILKKELVSYYNEQVFYIKDKYNSISNRIFLINGFDLKDIVIPTYYIKDINNAQDNISLDFDSLNYLKDKIDELEDKIPTDLHATNNILELDYLNRFEIPNLLRIIDNYNNDNQKVNKKSILTDINLIKSKLKKIIRNNSNNIKIVIICYEKICLLDDLINKIRVNKNNREYFILKDKINLFLEELTKAKKEDLIFYKDKYHNLEKEINEKYKDKNKQLYNNLLRYLNNAKETIDLLDNEEKNKTTKYHIETVEDANNLYKKYNKQVLLSSAIASIALENTRIGPIIIPSIIFANVMYANKYVVINKLNEILAKSINAIKGEDSIYTKLNGLKIDSKTAINDLLKSIALIKTKGKKALLNRVKNLAVVVKTKEHINNIKNNINTRNDEYKDLKTIKLYYEFILSNKTLEEFCSTRSLNDEDFNNLVEYINYKDNLDKKEVINNVR